MAILYKSRVPKKRKIRPGEGLFPKNTDEDHDCGDEKEGYHLDTLFDPIQQALKWLESTGEEFGNLVTSGDSGSGRKKRFRPPLYEKSESVWESESESELDSCSDYSDYQNLSDSESYRSSNSEEASVSTSELVLGSNASLKTSPKNWKTTQVKENGKKKDVKFRSSRNKTKQALVGKKSFSTNTGMMEDKRCKRGTKKKPPTSDGDDDSVDSGRGDGGGGGGGKKLCNVMESRKFRPARNFFFL
eukprot:TRINITY_DN4617_c0_g1_i1.p1 TRINITY_DN4617_c0_g1~~TRINITY_DN4617_c0_g1_i1.p1  ORF type:complete len:245 (-),score=66.12 TRINITY_DN4617_c0_g1_i1:133-867(-)